MRIRRNSQIRNFSKLNSRRTDTKVTFGRFNSKIALENNSGSGCDARSTCNASYSIVQATKAKGKPYGLTISYVLIQSRNVNLSDFFLARLRCYFQTGARE